MTDIKAALQAEIEKMESACDEIPFGLDEEDEQCLSVMREALKELSQRDAQIAALKADFISLDKQMSVLEQTGIADRDRAQKAEAQIAALTAENLDLKQYVVDELKYLSPTTPATDAAANALLADGVDRYIESVLNSNREIAEKGGFSDAVKVFEHLAKEASGFANQLREGK